MMVLIRGGGDLASGVGVRLHRSGFQVVITELPEPLVVRRKVSLAEAVHEGLVQVEGVTGKLVEDFSEIKSILLSGVIPVLIDPDLKCLEVLNPDVVVDARMRKKPPREGKELASLVIGLGPGFVAGENCHAVIETNRGHNLGRVLWQGVPEQDTGIPGSVQGYSSERVLRAPVDGVLQTRIEIGDRLKKGSLVAQVGEEEVLAPFDGILRGLLRDGTAVKSGFKIGDVDPREDPNLYKLISDKSRAIGGGVLEAILACPDLRSDLWT
jgi:xanthine dehydrogenase accessory factor